MTQEVDSQECKGQGIVHYESVAQRQIVNQERYLEVLTRLRQSVLRKRPKLWPDKWILHHANAPAHDAVISQVPG
jgi:hypothetical protein